ncbi:MAG: SpoIID/LytB domain-containing protein [bacterium]|nr:SpoIID/LytB domain-containing protein [bacterium]
MIIQPIPLISFLHRTVAFLISLLFLASPVSALDIRILLTAEAPEISLQGNFDLLAGNTTIKKISNEKVSIMDLKKSRSDQAAFEFQNQGGTFSIGSHQYKGHLRILFTDKASLVNIINIEDYIIGVLPNEISPAWPLEVIKAQAVAARTFAEYFIRKSQSNPYDLTDNTFSQVYKGIMPEKESFCKAMEETKDEILVFQDEPIQAFFHSTCGGHTEDALKVWGKHLAYLTGVPCSYCRDSIHYSWEARFSEAELLDKLKGYGLERIRNIVPEKMSSSGRWVSVKIMGLRKSIILPGNNFRILLGIEKLKSTKFRITKERDGFLIKGKGWGHGAGLCQWGAKTMAEKGYKYYQILRYYYRGTKIKKN